MKQKYFRFPVYFWEAAQMMGKRDRLAYYDAVIQYAFTGEEPELTGAAKNAFGLSRMYLDDERKRMGEG